MWRSGCSYGDDSSEGRHDRSVVHALLQAIHRGVRLGRFDRSTRYLSQFVQVNFIRIRNASVRIDQNIRKVFQFPDCSVSLQKSS